MGKREILNFSTTIQKDKIDSIAIGSFDGLHKAHQYLLSNLTINGALVVVEKKVLYALTPDKRCCQYTKYPCIFLDFDQIKDLTAEAFVSFLHREFPSLKKIVVGYDFRFGKERKGDASILQQLHQAEVIVIDEQSIDGISIHSKTIKDILQKNDIALANKLLGRKYTISGKVVSGQGLGKKELYATFNLDCGAFLLPAEGVYITQTKILDNWFPSVTFIGKRISVDNQFAVETHILGHTQFEEVLILDIAFYDFIRVNKHFDSLNLLKKQIDQDIKQAKQFFA